MVCVCGPRPGGGIQAQMVYPSAMEAYDAEALAPMLLTVADYSCGSGLLVTQLSSGEVLQTYCGGLAEPPVPTKPSSCHL